ncbi:hypothetical protein [Bergeyella cardium]|uniref:Uncharacterized protein n=1 Tax=Bergeyella cardium TaxID=1585976 RepID=A0A6P1QTL0_9FLAO|nr:hypothetical protein [Bergeyella cardium]QHN64838.1 hypothetical protein DBX24_02490 [Bergeyella cardium]WHE34145.1 hypothetical protein P8603_02505 [Bergeyella cardium]WHF60796.1 hypothetical protein O0R51_02500 [Bergeyella cardium]
MNKINFNQTGGFPLSTNILEAMQTAYSVFNHLGSLAGNFAIISGCEVTGNSVSNGAVSINSEILEFRGGNIGTNVIIREESESRVFEDGATKQVIFRRYATFGTSTPDKTFAWADFKRINNLIQLQENKTEKAATEQLLRRIEALESKKSPVPVGLIALWGKPASEPLPEGWKPYEPLSERFPLGFDEPFWNSIKDATNDAYDNLMPEEKKIGATGGEATHTLTIEEMPSHKHFYQRGKDYGSASGNATYHPDLGFDRMETESAGGNQPHNNMPPYRIIRYIQFVGFN